jgi:hypothetical protein
MHPQALRYTINHLFLPPKLPQEDDSGDIHSQTYLLTHVLESADAFATGLSHSDVGDHVKQCWQVLRRTLESVHRIHSGTHISFAELQKTVECMEVQGRLMLIEAISSHFKSLTQCNLRHAMRTHLRTECWCDSS